MLWKISEDFQETTPDGAIFVKEPELLLKKDSKTVISYLQKFLRMDDF